VRLRLIPGISVCLCLAFAATVKSDPGPALTADELAHYLGIHHWEGRAGFVGAFKIEILQVENGQVSGILTEGHSTPESNPAGMIVVIIGAGDAPGTVKADVTLGNYGVEGQEHGKLDDPKSGFGAISLPDRIKPGDYVLGGGYRTENGHAVVSGLMTDLKTGFLLRITPTAK
jgi:hypothetical protein